MEGLKPTETTQNKLSRRQFLKFGSLAAIGSATLGTGYSFFIEPHWIRVTRQDISISRLPLSLNGLRVLQISDIHMGHWISAEFVRELVSKANALKPDVVVLTGDYIFKSSRFIPLVMNELERLEARIGKVAVLGNHDWWHDGELTLSELKRIGVFTIDNDRMFVSEDRKLVKDASSGLCIGGVGDLWMYIVDFEKALNSVSPEIPRILLSHNPDVAERKDLIKGNYGIDLMICGHTHGGQIHLPILGSPILPSKYGQKYARGLVQGPACKVFVSSGVGVSTVPLRFGVAPEIVLFQLQSTA